VFVAPTGGSATETIQDQTGSGQVSVVDAAGGLSTLGGTAQQPLEAVAGQSDAWQDSQGCIYTFDPASGALTVADGVLGSGNEVIVDNFNLGAATESVAQGGSANGFLGFHFSDEVELTAGATAGTDPPAPNFLAGTTQSYTVSVDAPSALSQTITITLSGASPDDFGLDSGTSVTPLNSDGTFTITIPAGRVSASFSLANIGDVGGAASLQLVASIRDPNDPTTDTISSAALTQTYVEPTEDPFNLPSSGTLYYEGAYTTSGGIAYNLYDADYGDVLSPTPVGGGSNGNNYINLLGEPNSSVNGGTGNDTIFAEFGAGQADGGVDVISGNGGQDDILAAGGASDGLATISIYGNSKTDLASAIADANTADAAGETGDLIVNADPGTVVGGDGNDLILTEDGGVVVAGPGNDTIAVGAPILYTSPDWEGDSSHPPTPSPGPDGVTWSTSLSNGSLVVQGGSITLGRLVDTPPPSQYEGNYDDTGGIFAATDDTIFGGAGNDLIYLSNGNDEVHLGNGDSTVNGGMGSDTIFGGSGNDSIAGGGGSDYITAGSGTDVITGGGGNNTIFGGSGADTISAGGTVEGLEPEEIGNDYVQAGSGNTLIFGSGGSDTLIGGSGRDTIQSGNGNESIVAGSGDTSINGGYGPDTIVAGGGSDTIWGSLLSTTIYGGTGVDFISGVGGEDVIYAGDGGTSQDATTVTAGSGDTTIYGGAGADQISGGSGNDIIYAGDGGTSYSPTQIIAGSGSTTIYGGEGIDSIEGGSGTDILYAGDGGNYVTPTYVTAGSGVATLSGGAGVSVLVDNNSGHDVLEGDSGDTTLIGSGDDTLIAGSGADYLAGGSNSTYIFGSDIGVAEVVNDGAETLDFDSSLSPSDLSLSAAIDSTGGAALTIDEGDGSITVDGGLTSGNVAGVDFSGSGSMSLAQLIQEEASNGNVAEQTLAGTQGNLIFDASAGDAVDAGSGQDTISAWGDNDTLSAGSGGADIFAEGVNDSVVGGAGSDTLDALAAGTTLVGGTGNEVFQVSDSTDVVQGQAGAASNHLYSSVSYTLPTNVDTLTLTGTASLTATGNGDAENLITANLGDDSLIAGSGSDTLVGGAGSDTMVGGAGDDMLVAGSGADLLEGGAGSTTYVFNPRFGQAEIKPGSGAGVIQFGAGFEPGDFTVGLTTDSNGGPAMLIEDGSSVVTVGGGLAGSISSFDFSGGGRFP
jgi:Ca2+-binding RTX toxin-like protein